MERKTKVEAEAGSQGLTITREFDLPVELLFRAHTDAEIFAEWMNTKVIKLESRKHGSWQIETSNPQGNVAFIAHGTFHEFIPNEKITRTFQMEVASFDAQLEFLEFEKLTEDTSRLTMQVVYRSPELRDQMLKLPFAQGLNMAHNKLQQIVSNLK